LTLKKTLKFLISNSIPLKFIRLFFHKNLICSQGITYNPCAEGCGGGFFILKNIITESFNNGEQNGYQKLLIGCVLGNDGNGGKGLLFVLQSLSTIKKGTRIPDVQMTPFKVSLTTPSIRNALA